MAENSPISGAAGIAAVYVLQDILDLQTSNAKPADRLVIAAQIERWLADQSIGNIVAVTQPGNIERFTLLPNSGGSNVYIPPPGSSSQLALLPTAGYSYRNKTGETITFNPASAVAASRAISWNSPSGVGITFSYNSDGKLATVANPATLRQLNLHYASQRLTSVDDGAGRTINYQYDGQSNLVSFSDPLQQTTRFNYSSIGQLSQIFYPANPTNPFLTTTYDSLGRVAQQFDAAGNVSSLFFGGARSEIDDAIGTAHVSYFSQRGKTLTSIEGLGSSDINAGVGIPTGYTYDGRDRLIAVTSGEGVITRYSYSADFNENVLQVTKIPKPGSSLTPQVTTFSYDPRFNKPTIITDPLGLVTSNSYDSSTGNLTVSIADFGASPHFNARSSFTYNSAGQVLTATDSLGSVTGFSYDGGGNPASILRDAGTGRLNQLTSFAYNAVGDIISTTDPRGNVTTNNYDAVRRLVTTTAPNRLTTINSYDSNGQLVQTQQSANGSILRSTSASYTLTGKTAATTDANGNMTRYTYDALDRLSRVTDPVQRVTSFIYDALSRQKQVLNTAIQASPLLQRSFTPDGLVFSLTDAKTNTTTFTYDTLNRLATIFYPSGTEGFSYDADNNILTRRTRAGDTIGFAYDTLNRLKTKTPPSPATAVNYSYDLAGRLTSVSDSSAAITAAVPPSGPSVQFGMGYSYDALNRPTAVNWNPAPTAAAPAAGSVTFGHSYNKVNQRTGQTVTDNTWFNYPAATASTVSYSADALNRYIAVGAVTPTYDGNSNLTSDGTFTLGYDAENRLTSASGAGNTASYTYDAQGRRKTKTVNGTTTVFITDAGNREVLEYDGTSGAILRWYAYGLGSNDVLNQMNMAAATRVALVPDILGSVIGSQDSSSGALSRIGYLPYGKSANAPGTFGYTAQRIDPEIGGMYYYRARHYSSAWGRFLQADPSGYSGGNNLYAYVGNDPLNLVDPTGLASDNPQGVWASGTSAIIGLVDTTGAFTGAASVAARVGGLGPAAAVTLPLALSGDTCQACNQDPFYYATYTRTNPTTDQVYSGRTSGYGDPNALVQARGLQQPILTGEGFSSPVLDQGVSVQQNPNAYAAIRGREQQLIDFNGGAQSMGGTSRNMINGISNINPLRSYYIQQSINLFGALPDNSPGARGQ